MTTLPFMDGFEQFRDPSSSGFVKKLNLGGWFTTGSEIAPGNGRYGDSSIVCRNATFYRDLPAGSGLFFGVAVNKTDRGQVLKVSAGGDEMIVYTSRLDGFAYLDDTSLDAIPLNSLWYYYEVGIQGGNMTVRINDRELGTVPLKPGIAAASTVRVEMGATMLVPPPGEGEQSIDPATSTYDDFYAVSGGFLGTVTVTTRLPSGVWENEWQVSGASNAQTAVGQLPFDEMNRYIAEEIEGNITAFVSNKIINPGYPILSTGLVMVARKPETLNRAIETSISHNNGHVTPRAKVIELAKDWQMHYITFSQDQGDTAELLQASPFAVKLVNS